MVIEGECRGVFAALATEPGAFSDEDFRFFQVVSRWVALVTHRAELADRVAQPPAQRHREEVAAELSHLTPREQELVSLVAEGLKNNEIAQRLTITPGTVANHVEHILEKLGLRSRTQIAVWAVEHGLYHSDPAKLARPAPDDHSDPAAE
ncbi:MAG: response regulator transcription factor [Chloroflexi bacterium]|nr:response regulator transcription factor [Chloroflexota bacterium]